MTDAPGHSPLDSFLGNTPRRRRRHLVSVIALVLAAIAVLALAQRFLSGSQGPYYFAPVTVGAFAPLVSERTVVRSEQELVIRARVAGPVRTVSVKPGDTVRFGQVLAVIDPAQARLTQEAEQATLIATRAEMTGAQVEKEQASAQLARFEDVWRKSGGRVPSLNEMEAARARARLAEERLRAAAARERAARLKMASGEEALDRATLRAPFAAIVTQVGAVAGARAQEGTPLLALAPKGSRPTMTIALPADRANTLAPGARASVRLDDMPDRDVHATLARITRTTQGRRATFVLDNPDGKIRAGMGATLEIELAKRPNALLVPNTALAFSPDASADRSRPCVYLLSDDDTPRRVYVTTGGTDGKLTEVFSREIAAGDQVIIGWRDGAGPGD